MNTVLVITLIVLYIIIVVAFDIAYTAESKMPVDGEDVILMAFFWPIVLGWFILYSLLAGIIRLYNYLIKA